MLRVAMPPVGQAAGQAEVPEPAGRRLWPAMAGLILAFTSLSAGMGRAETVSASDLEKRLPLDTGVVHVGDRAIGSAEEISGPLIIVRGALQLARGARVSGDVWVIRGHVEMRDDARITGTLWLVDSEIYATDGARVGRLKREHCDCEPDTGIWITERRLAFRSVRKPSKKSDAPPTRHEWRPIYSPARPTRVRYDLVHAGLQYLAVSGAEVGRQAALTVDVPAYADTPHGFLAFNAEGRLSLPGDRWVLTAAGGKVLTTPDVWQLMREENSLLLVMSANEYADYYERRGAIVSVAHQPAARVGLQLSGFWQQDVSMPRGEVYSVFGDASRLADNPEIDEGRRAGVRFHLVHDTRIDPAAPGRSWWGAVTVEAGRLELDIDNSDPQDYVAFTLAGATHVPVLQAGFWSVGARLSSAFTEVPRQLTQSMFGYGALRGAVDEPFGVRRGDRLAYLSTEFRWALPDVPIIEWLYRRWDAIVFGDAGLLVDTSEKLSPFAFLGHSSGSWVTTVGAGVTGESILPYLGVYVAADTDRLRDPRFILRLARSY